MLRSIQRQMRRKRKAAVSSVMALGMTLSVVSPNVALAAEDEDVVNLRLMETTDIHSHVMDYDYFTGSQVNDFGLVKTATLIRQAKDEAKNSLLIDNGDLIQGNPLADYMAKEKEWAEDEVHPVYEAMNILDYDVGNYGNHEFNYGLEYLKKTTDGSEFPYVNANVYKDDGDDNPDNNENYFDPYVILDKTVVDEDGEEHTIKVGVIGFVPPQIMRWDRSNLEGKVITKGIVETAEKFVPQMQEEGADMIVAVPHSGMGDVTQDGMEENATYDLSKVDGIDAILFGHAHAQFPGEDYASLEGVNIDKGTVNGTPSVMPGFWGSHLGMIDFTLEKVDGEWNVNDAQSKLRAIQDPETDEALVDADEEIKEAVKDDHQGTIDYVNSAVGQTESPLYSYFSQVQDDPTIQIVTDAQKAYVKNYIQGTELEGLPVLSAGAPFKAGRDGITDFTDIEAGDLAIKDTTSLYKYPNTVNVVKLSGAEVREWLEWSAGQFNQIDPKSNEEQLLVKKNTRNGGFPSYNFDVIDGVSYEIDVTVPRRYDNGGTEVINDTHRIKNLTYNGEPVDPEQEFLVATNNYRAGMQIANPDGESIVIESPDENRQVLVDYIRENGTVDPKADGNWSFAPVKGNPDLVFYSSPEAQKYSENNEKIAFDEKMDNGFAKYSIDLASKNNGNNDQKEDKENNGKNDDKENKGNDPKENDSTDKENDMTYVVKSGDTLGKIAAQYGVSWKTLKDYNNIENVRALMPGQEIMIPVPDENAGYEVHLVKQGDTLGKIAAQYDVHWKDLASYNELENPHFLEIGQEIKIPKN